MTAAACVICQRFRRRLAEKLVTAATGGVTKTDYVIISSYASARSGRMSGDLQPPPTTTTTTTIISAKNFSLHCFPIRRPSTRYRIPNRRSALNVLIAVVMSLITRVFMLCGQWKCFISLNFFRWPIIHNVNKLVFRVCDWLLFPHFLFFPGF